MNDYTIDSLLKKALELGASDLHFIVGEVPSFRIDGKIIKSKLEPVTEDDMMQAIDTMAILYEENTKLLVAYQYFDAHALMSLLLTQSNLELA